MQMGMNMKVHGKQILEMEKVHYGNINRNFDYKARG